MKPFWIYTELAPAFGRTDMFLAVTKYAAEPEPYRDIVHFPKMDPLMFPLLARKLWQLRCRLVPSFGNFGLHEERDYLSFTLGRLSVAPTLSLLDGPATAEFWTVLREGLQELHEQGLTYGHLSPTTVAVTEKGLPLLFDFAAARGIRSQSPELDWSAFHQLEQRFGQGQVGGTDSAHG